MVGGQHGELRPFRCSRGKTQPNIATCTNVIYSRISYKVENEQLTEIHDETRTLSAVC